MSDAGSPEVKVGSDDGLGGGYEVIHVEKRTETWGTDTSGFDDIHRSNDELDRSAVWRPILDNMARQDTKSFIKTIKGMTSASHNPMWTHLREAREKKEEWTKADGMEDKYWLLAYLSSATAEVTADDPDEKEMEEREKRAAQDKFDELEAKLTGASTKDSDDKK